MIILCYHSISGPTEDRIDPTIIVSPSNFEDQLEFLADSGHVISMGDYLDAMRSGRPLPKNSAVLTFDDGYKDNWTTAFPLLKKFGFPATFFLATDLVGAPQPKWEDRIACFIQRSKAPCLSLGLQTGMTSIDLSEPRARYRAINHLIGLLASYEPARREHVLDAIREQSGAETGDLAGVMMSWDDARKIAATPGMTIGAHTVTHPHLSHSSDDQIYDEVVLSRQVIEKQVGAAVRFFCYPYGDFDDRVVRQLQAANYECAGTLVYGSNTLRTDPFRLKRIQAPNTNGMSMRIGLQLRGSWFGEQLKQAYNLVNRLS